MDIIIIYGILALSISLTSYINIYKPAVELYKEITDEDVPQVGSIIYKFVWIVLGFVLAPFVGFMLLKGRNDNYIRDLVVAWIENDE